MQNYLCSRMKNPEDRFTERKPEGAKAQEIRQTLVAFANSLEEGEQAILFLGLSDKGDVIGVTNTDSTQKRIRQIAKEDCFPPVPCTTQVLEHSGKQVVAVIIEHSKSRPHFTGHAYIRKGSESVKASAELLEEMIASRNTKAGAILRSKGKLVSVVKYSPVYKRVPKIRHADAGNKIETIEYEARIIECNANTVRLDRNGTCVAEPLDKISISRDEKEWRLKLIIDDK